MCTSIEKIGFYISLYIHTNPNKSYVIEDIKSQLKISIYEHLVRPPGEWDFLLIVSHLKMMLNVEVKKQIGIENRGKHNLNDSLRSASHQCKEHAEYASEAFSPFLTDEWQFIKIAAILPGELDYDRICPHCSKFVITGKDYGEINEKINKI